MMTEASTSLHYVRNPANYCCAQAIRLLINGGQAYPEMLAAIHSAKKQIDLETYILRADRMGLQFQQALISAAQRGVRVRLMYDWFGSLALPPEYVSPLLQAGAKVRVFHPLVWYRPAWAWNRRTHRKILVVDREISFTGGLNIGDEYAALENGGYGWRDTHVRLDGPDVADQLAALFEYGWQEAIHYDHSATATARLRSSPRLQLNWQKSKRRWLGHIQESDALQYRPNGIMVKILGNELFRYRHLIQEAYLYAIRQAKSHILIENAYFIPNRKVRRALIKAARRGVTVTVVVAEKSDVPITSYATRHFYRELLEGGIHIYEWSGSMMHAKTAVIDDAWALVGSYNFDHRSLLHQLEAVAIILDSSFARTLCQQTQTDIQSCRKVNLVEHQRRPWGQKFLEILAYRLRIWL